jgi:lysine-specific demethylase 3
MDDQVIQRPKSSHSGKKRGRPRKTQLGQPDSKAQSSNDKSIGEVNGVYYMTSSAIVDFRMIL